MNKHSYNLFLIIVLIFNFINAQIDYQRQGGEFYPEVELTEQDSLIWPVLFDISIDIKDIKGLNVKRDEFYSKFIVSIWSEYGTSYTTTNGEKIDFINEKSTVYGNEFIKLQTKESNLNLNRKRKNLNIYEKEKHNYLFYDDFHTKSVQLVESPFDVNWKLNSYPFDEQELKFKFTSELDTSVIRLVHSKKFPSTFNSFMESLPAGYTIKSITSRSTFNKDQSELITITPGLKRAMVTETIEIIANLDRRGSWLYIKLFFGGFISWFISWIIFFIPQRQFESRTNLAVAAVFGALGNKYFVESVIPNVQVLTKADVINNVVIVLIAYNILIMIAQQNKKMKWSILETDKGALIKSGALFVLINFIIRIW